MTFSYGNNKRQDVTSNTTLEAIKNRERTATTRYESDGHIDYWKNLKIGDIIEWEGQNGEKVLVEVTKPLHKLVGSGKTAEQWSKLEGWSVDYFNSKVKPKLSEAWQIEYKLATPKNSSYFTDADFPQFKQQVDEAIQKAKDTGKTIVIPADGIGTGKAMLKEKAPKLFEYLQQKLNKLKNNNSNSFQKTETPTLTKNFAGVGSRDIENYNVQKDGKWQPREEYVGIEKENAAKQAIRDVYEKTLAENNPGSTEENVDNGSVNIEFYEENGTLYQFISEPGETMTGQYKLGGQDWKDLSNPEKTLRRLKSGKTPQVEAKSSPSIAATPATARKVSIFGKSLDLSKIGINFDLNSGQQSAIDAVSEWFATETNEPFVIKGYAGTGKTSITRIITSGLSASGIKFKVAAFTHQAKKVASKATKSKAVTLFSLLSMQHISSEAEVGGASKFSEATSEKIPYDGVVIVDEASMVGDKMRETILSMAKENNSRVIFIGDPGQLPPVENKDALGRPKMSEALESSFSSELTEVMRVSNGNKIIDVATAARKAQQTDLIIKHGDVAMSGYARRSSFNEIGGGFYVGEAGRANAVKSFIDKFFKSKLFASDPTYAKIIAYRNVSVDAYNDMVRSALGKTGIVEVGESLIGQDNLYASTPGGGKRPLLLNGDEYTVVGVGEQEIIYSDAVPGVEIPVVRIDITTDSSDSAGGSFYLLSDYSDEKMDEIQGAILQKQADISRMYMDDKYMLKRARAIFYSSLRSDFVTLKNISNPNKLTENDSDSLKQRMLRHGYAITTHKSQGSEFNNILVDDSDIRRMSGNLDDIFYKKALYTAITRAKDKAIIITNGDRYDSATGTKIPANEQNEIPSIMLDNDLLEQMASSEIRPSDNC